jgi:aldehyde dehydrogenase (NAD+)
LENAALRVIQGRFTNSGQTCTAPDYVFVHSKIKEKLTTKFIEKVKEFFTDKPENSLDLVKIVSPFHVNRLEELIKEDHGGKILIGGTCDAVNRFVYPTLIDNPKFTSRLMQEEIFGPILPIFEFEKIDNVIKFINERPKPLALYYFGGIFNKNKHRFVKETSSGSIAINESLFQVLNPELPFGGVQNSGQLSLHGKFGFDSCSHKKAVFDKLSINGKIMENRYPPTNESKIKRMLAFQQKTKHLYQSHIIQGLLTLLVVFLALIFYVKIVDPHYGGVLGFIREMLIGVANGIDKIPFKI